MPAEQNHRVPLAVACYTMRQCRGYIVALYMRQ